MNISNSKKQLAKIISENGGWRDASLWAAQDKEHSLTRNVVSFYMGERPWFNGGTFWLGNDVSDARIVAGELVKNWHQTILSRDEYFHLHPAPDADGWVEWKGGECPVEKGALVDIRILSGKEMLGQRINTRNWVKDGSFIDIIAYRLHKPEVQVQVENRTICHLTVTDGPTIEQLAADYRAKLKAAHKAQEDADAANREADAALCKLEHAGEAIGLLVSPIKDDRNLAED